MVQIPTYVELYNSIIDDYEAKLGITINQQAPNFIRTRAAVQAGRLKLYYIALGKVQKNILPDTADSEANGGTLERWGRIKLGRSRFPATAGRYMVQATGTTGAIIPVNTTFKANDDTQAAGFLFVIDTAYTLDGITNEFEVRALTAGLDSRLFVADKLTATAPIANVDAEVVVQSEVEIPQAQESEQEYREKIQEAFRLEAQGGAGADYRLWSADAQGVAEVYPYASSGTPNLVDLYVEATKIDSTDGKGTPTTQILDDVESAIEDPTPERPSRKPLTANVNYQPITPLDVIITIDGTAALTPEQVAAISAELETYIDTVRPFVDSIDVLAEKNDTITQASITATIYNAVSGAAFGAVTINVNAVDVTQYQFTGGDIPFLDSVVFNP